MRDYQLVSPSLDGILRHESIVYEGLNRPSELIRAFDSPARAMADKPRNEHDQRLLEQYFHDLYGIFVKKLSSFAMESSAQSDEALKLQAMLQELIKVRGLISAAYPTIEK